MEEKDITKFQKLYGLLAKNPVVFVATVFFLMFWITYFINIRKNDNAEEYWKELYIKERDDNDALKEQLLINAGVLKEQSEIIKDADSTLRKVTSADANQLLNNK